MSYGHRICVYTNIGCFEWILRNLIKADCFFMKNHLNIFFCPKSIEDNLLNWQNSALTVNHTNQDFKLNPNVSNANIHPIPNPNCQIHLKTSPFSMKISLNSRTINLDIHKLSTDNK